MSPELHVVKPDDAVMLLLVFHPVPTVRLVSETNPPAPVPR